MCLLLGLNYRKILTFRPEDSSVKLQSNMSIKCLSECVQICNAIKKCIVTTFDSSKQQCDLYERKIKMTNETVPTLDVYMKGKIYGYGNQNYG